MEAAFQPVGLKAGFLKNLVVRQEVDLRAGLLRPPHGRQKSVDELHRGNAALVGVIVDIAVLIDFYVQALGQRVHHRGAHAVESAAGLVGLVVEFTSGVQGGEDDPLCGDAFFMHLHRDTAAVVLHGAGAVGLQRHPDAGAALPPDARPPSYQ